MVRAGTHAAHPRRPVPPYDAGRSHPGPTPSGAWGGGGGGKIERWHQTLKNRILLENYYLPGDLEAEIATFVDHYNTRRTHESLDNLTPTDVYTGRGGAIRLERQRIKRQTLLHRRLQHIQHAA